ncbi:hypothetical protein GOODEAATRI_016465, partial [Goodea atripinnis]
EEKMVVETENHKSEEVAEAKTGHERDEVQGESCESKATQGEEDEGEGGPKGGGAGRRASLHHTASPLRVQRNGAGSHSASSDYELSLDLKNKQIEMLEHKYGGHLISRRAACKIQTAFRQYQLSKNFEKIRNSLLESRLPRRISLRKVRMQNTEGFSAERALAEGCNLAGIPLVRSPSLPASVGSTLTDLEDSFTEQVQSLAKSIDDALSNWSLKTMCSLQEGSAYQFSADSFNAAAAAAASGVGGGGEGGGVGQATVHQAPVDPSDLSRSASKLMMAFRDDPMLLRSSPVVEPLDVKRCGSETADNSSEQMSSSSTSTEARSTSEASSKEALQAMILSLPRYHCENPASCKSPTLSTDVMRKRLYRIGLNLFNL